MQLEFGGGAPLDAQSWAGAKERGWIDPRSIPKAHPDFESRAAWGENPVQEVVWSDIGIPRMVKLLADAADQELGATRRVGLMVTIFWRQPDDSESPVISEEVAVPEPVGVSVGSPATTARSGRLVLDQVAAEA